MSRPLHAANAAIGRIGRMPYGLARTQAAEQEVRQIEAEGPVEALAYALGTLVDSMFWAGEAEKSFVPFTRMVRLWDEHPEHFDSGDRHSLFWMFKWMVADLVEFPSVPAAQVEATIADMARRYAIEGFGTNAVMHQRFIWAVERGATAEADAAFDAWCATPRDEFSQCESCEPGDRAAYLVSRGRHDEAIRVVERALADSPSCASEPADMLSYLQLAYLAVGRDADAASAHRRTVAHLAEAAGSMTGARGRLLEFLARSGNDAAALRRLEADQDLLVGGDTPRERLNYLSRVGVATHLIAADGGADIPLRLTAAPAATVGELDTWARAQATELAAAFDARNGTDAASRHVAESWSAERDGRVVDLSILRLDGGDAREAVAAPAPLDGADDDGADEAPDTAGLLRANAEVAAREGDLEGASAGFLAASQAAEQEGRLAEAGWALADAAQCARLSADHVGATEAFGRAVALLEAGGADPADVVRVLTAYAASASEVDAPRTVLPVVERWAAALDAMPAPPAADQADPADPVTEELAERRRLARSRARAELVDVTARLLATAGEHAAAARTAEEAAEAMAGLGAPGDAAHAFWLAGRMHVALGDPSTAVWHLESAVEGFDLVGDRRMRAEVASELIAALRAAGRDAEADAVQP